MYEAKYRPEAKRDVKKHARYLSAIDPDLGLRFADAIEKTVAEICLYPAGTRVRKVGGTLVQMRLINGFRRYLIYYRTHVDHVEILRIIHGSRDQDSAFGKR